MGEVLKTERTHSSFPQVKAEYLGLLNVEFQDVKANKESFVVTPELIIRLTKVDQESRKTSLGI